MGGSKAPGAERGIDVTVKALRQHPGVKDIDFRLPAQPAATTSALDIKTAVAEMAGIPASRIRLLHGKKPVPDSKVLKEIAGDDENVVAFTVMVLGGGAAAPAPTSSSDTTANVVPPVAPGEPRGTAVLETEEFWSDLKGFLQQRLRDESVAEDLLSKFRGSVPKR
jgi:hypothetical protein